MKKFICLLLACAAMLSLCACDLNFGSSSNSKNDFSYTVEDQKMFSYEGLTVSVIPGKYNDDPQFHVTNESDKDFYVVLDAVAYDDVILANSLNSVGTVYKVTAGMDQPLSDCESYSSGEYYFVTMNPNNIVIDGANMSGSVSSTIIYASTQMEVKREYRFAVYSVDPDNIPEKGSKFVPDEADLVYRSELVLLQSSDYDQSKVDKQLPTETPLYTYDSIKVWKNTSSFSAMGSLTTEGSITSGNADVATKPNDSIISGDSFTFNSATSLVVSTLSFFIDNGSNMDIRVEMTFTPDPNWKDKEEDKKEEGEKEDEKESIPQPTSYFMTSEIPAGKASRNMDTSSNTMTPSWLRSSGVTMEIRIYNQATGELLAEDSITLD